MHIVTVQKEDAKRNTSYFVTGIIEDQSEKRCGQMKRELILAVDQGTSGLKLTVFDSEGSVVAERTRTYVTDFPQEGYAQQDAEGWWIHACEGIRDILGSADIHPSEIKGIGVDGTSWALIPVDSAGRVLYPAMIWLDRRAAEEALWMKETIGEETLVAFSGNPVDAAYITPKMLWFKNHEPELYGATHKFLNSKANSFLQLFPW